MNALEIDEIAYDIIESEINNIPIHTIDINNQKISYLINLKLSKITKNTIFPIVKSVACNCNTCIERVKNLLTALNKNGNCYSVNHNNNTNIKLICDTILNNSINISNVEIQILDDSFYQKFLDSNNNFQHLKIPKLTVDNNLVTKYYDLKHYINGSFENRFKKIINHQNYIKKIKNVIPQILRTNHWLPTLIWTLTIIEKANNIEWDNINIPDKISLMIFAILTGNSENNIHYNLQKVVNFLDFADDNLNDFELIEEMNKRSDPNTYMVSRVTTALNKHGITSLVTATLVWESPTDFDLGAYVTDEFNEIHYIYYRNMIAKDKNGKIIGKLDHDSNASTILKAPSENISILSVSKLVKIVVINFTNRDGGNCPIKYEITIRKSGYETETIKCEWIPSHARDEITITEFQVYEKDLAPLQPEISDSQIDKFKHKNNSWLKYFGDPTSSITNINYNDLNNNLLYIIPKNISFTSKFNQFIRQNSSKELLNKIKLEDFIYLVKSGAYNNKHISFKNFKDIVPAYVTNPITSTGTIVSRNVNSICVYHSQNEFPIKPDSTLKSLARLDQSWIDLTEDDNESIKNTIINNSIKILAILEINNELFFALDKLKLPNSNNFPLAGGFYGSDLLPNFHEHRSQYGCCHSLVKPFFDKKENNISLIGTVLSSITTIELLVDNQIITISK